MVIVPTVACRARLAQVSHRADTASGTAMTTLKTPMPSIEPTPNNST